MLGACRRSGADTSALVVFLFARYKMAETINSQLVHASGDLNEIIKGLNAQEVDSAQDDAVDDVSVRHAI